MAGIMRAYSFAHYMIMINGRLMENFGEGDDVVATEYREDAVSDTVGADGNMMASISANESAEITLKFLHNAPENDYLEDLYYQFRTGEIDGIAVSIINSMTGKGEVATTGYIPKLASTERGNTAADREWLIVVPKLAIQKQIR